MKQYGEVQWSHMTEQERQTHIIQKRLAERRLRQAGKFDEVNLVLGKYLQDKKGKNCGDGLQLYLPNNHHQKKQFYSYGICYL